MSGVGLQVLAWPWGNGGKLGSVVRVQRGAQLVMLVSSRLTQVPGGPRCDGGAQGLSRHGRTSAHGGTRQGSTVGVPCARADQRNGPECDLWRMQVREKRQE